MRADAPPKMLAWKNVVGDRQLLAKAPAFGDRSAIAQTRTRAKRGLQYIDIQIQSRIVS